MKSSTLLFFLVWFILIFLGPLTVIRNTPISLLMSNQLILINFLQRFAATLAFSMLFTQIVLGAFMDRWIERFGGWVFKFHVTQGAIIYTLILSHALLFVLFNYKAGGRFDPFYVFTDLCVLCSNKTEFFYNLGRIGFWLITLAVVAAKLRTQPWLRTHWRKLHILNYLAFIVIALHGRMVGSDTLTSPYSWVLIIYSLVVIGIIGYKFYKRLHHKGY